MPARVPIDELYCRPALNSIKACPLHRCGTCFCCQHSSGALDTLHQLLSQTLSRIKQKQTAASCNEEINQHQTAVMTVFHFWINEKSQHSHICSTSANSCVVLTSYHHEVLHPIFMCTSLCTVHSQSFVCICDLFQAQQTIVNLDTVALSYHNKMRNSNKNSEPGL